MWRNRNYSRTAFTKKIIRIRVSLRRILESHAFSFFHIFPITTVFMKWFSRFLIYIIWVILHSYSFFLCVSYFLSFYNYYWKRSGKEIICGSLIALTGCFTFHYIFYFINYNSKREDLEEEDQGEDERNVIL